MQNIGKTEIHSGEQRNIEDRLRGNECNKTLISINMKERKITIGNLYRIREITQIKKIIDTSREKHNVHITLHVTHNSEIYTTGCDVSVLK